MTKTPQKSEKLEEIDPVKLLQNLEGNSDEGGVIESETAPQSKDPEAGIPTNGLSYDMPKEMDDDLKVKLMGIVDVDPINADVEFANVVGVQLLRNSYSLIKMLASVESMLSNMSVMNNQFSGKPELTQELKKATETQSTNSKNSIRFK